jgi:hypothetical protein
MEVITPSGEAFVRAETKFKTLDAQDLQSRIGYDLVSIPISEVGFFKVHIWLDGDTENKAEYRFYLKHVPPPETATPSLISDSVG